ncbi:MAG: hypothetical protein ACRC92_26915 [Peptostreptococcaceae bacterium]
MIDFEMLSEFDDLSLKPKSSNLFEEMFLEAIQITKIDDMLVKKMQVINDKRISAQKFSAVVLPFLNLNDNMIFMNRMIRGETCMTLTECKSYYTPIKYKDIVQNIPMNMTNVDTKSIYDKVKKGVPNIAYTYRNMTGYQYKNVFYDSHTFLQMVFTKLKVNKDDAVEEMLRAFSGFLNKYLLPRYNRYLVFDLDMEPIPYRTAQQIKEFSRKNNKSLLSYILIAFRYIGIKKTLEMIMGENPNSNLTIVFTTKNGVMKMGAQTTVAKINTVLRSRLIKRNPSLEKMPDKLDKLVSEQTDKDLELKMLNKLLLKSLALRAESIEEIDTAANEDTDITEEEVKEVKGEFEYIQATKTNPNIKKLTDEVQKVAMSGIEEDVDTSADAIPLIKTVAKVEEIINENDKKNSYKRFDENVDIHTNEPTLDTVAIKSDADVILQNVKEKIAVRDSREDSPRVKRLRERLNNKYGKRHPDDELANLVNTKLEPVVFDTNVPGNLNENTFVNFDKCYENNTKDYDMESIGLHFANGDVPLFLQEMTKTDSSTRFDYKDTYKYRFLDEDGVSHTFSIDIPKLYDGKFLFLNGSKKVLSKTIKAKVITRLPNRTRFSSEYKKLFYEYSGGKYFTPMSSKLLRGLDNVDEPMTVFTLGNVSDKLSSNGVAPQEYIDIAKRVSLYKNGDDYIDFSKFEYNEKGEAKIGVLNGHDAIYDVYYERVIIFNPETGKTEYVRLSELVLALIDIHENEVYKKHFEKITTMPKAYAGTHVTILSQSIPLIHILMYTDGLIETLDTAGVSYSIVPRNEENKTVKINNARNMCVPLNDCFIVFDLDTVANISLISPLTKLPLEEYTLEQLNDSDYTSMILNDYAGSNNFSLFVDNFKFGMMDPRTVEILADHDQPTDWLGVNIYCNQLLATGPSYSDIALEQARVVSAETLVAVGYGAMIDEYSDFVVKKKRGSKTAKFSVSKGAAIKLLSELPNIKEYSELNPLAELDEYSTCSLKGYGGVNVAEAYDVTKRMFDESYYGLISLPTAYAASIGVVNHMTLDPKIMNTRGYMKVSKPNERKHLSAKNLLSISEIATVGVANHDDSPRDAMNMMQVNHLYGVVDGDIARVTTGFDEVSAHLSTDFSRKAKQDGTIVDINDGFICIKYNDGTTDALSLGTIGRDSAKAAFIDNKMEIVGKLKKGSKVKAGQLIAANKYFYKTQGDNVYLTQGPIITVAVTSEIAAYEDSTMVSESTSKRLSAPKIKNKTVHLTKDDIIKEAITDSDVVRAGSVLMKFVSSTGVDLIDVLGEGADDINTVSKTIDRAGKVVGIKVYYCCEKEELSKSLKSFVNKVGSSLENKKGYSSLDKYGDVVGKCMFDDRPMQVNEGAKIGGSMMKKGDVLVEYFVIYMDRFSKGDKATFHTALKGVDGIVLPDDKMPRGYTTGIKIDAVLSVFGVMARMCESVKLVGLATRALEALEEQCFKTIEGPGAIKVKIKNIKERIFKFLDIMDPTGNNRQIYEQRFDDMNDIQFVKFVKGKIIRMYVETWEYDLKMDNVKNACKFVGVRPTERLIVPNCFETDYGGAVVTEYEQLILRVPVKRLRQFSASESYSTSDSESRNKAGQVIGESKAAGISDLEVSALVAKGYHHTLLELLTVRADNLKKDDMLNSLTTTGRASFPQDALLPENKVSLQLLDAMYLAAGISTDLIEDLDKR